MISGSSADTRSHAYEQTDLVSTQSFIYILQRTPKNCLRWKFLILSMIESRCTDPVRFARHNQRNLRVLSPTQCTHTPQFQNMPPNTDHAHNKHMWTIICNFNQVKTITPWWWILRDPKHVGVIFNVLSFRILYCTDFQWVESSWNVMAHCDARERKWGMEWVASTLHTTSEHTHTHTHTHTHSSSWYNALSVLMWCICLPLSSVDCHHKLSSHQGLLTSSTKKNYIWTF